MKRGEFFRQHISSIPACFFFIFFFSALSGQKTDFSGQWQMDLAKSDANYGKYYSGMTCVVKQSPQTITVERISTDKDGKKASMDPVVYTLDGKETAKEQYGGTDKYSAIWSADKKNLTLRCKRTVSGADYGSNESYSLSEDGKVLTVSITDLSGGSNIVEVYNKK